MAMRLWLGLCVAAGTLLTLFAVVQRAGTAPGSVWFGIWASGFLLTILMGVLLSRPTLLAGPVPIPVRALFACLVGAWFFGTFWNQLIEPFGPGPRATNTPLGAGFACLVALAVFLYSARVRLLAPFAVIALGAAVVEALVNRQPAPALAGLAIAALAGLPLWLVGWLIHRFTRRPTPPPTQPGYPHQV